ncbi:MAG: XrtA/PEP-CTERM system-associated ATPase [Alphaproteobacteria bacterium]
MYTDYFKLSAAPFQLSPDPRFYFASSGHKKAMAYLTYGLSQGEGFIVVTGEVGSGKTTLIRRMLTDLDAERYIVANVVTSRLGPAAALRSAAAAFGIDQTRMDKATLLRRMETFLFEHRHAGRKALLVVDEAQNIPFPALEELRMLSNFQTDDQALLQCLLLGQPQFRDMLAEERFEQLRQRVVVSCHLQPLSEAETRAYIGHRLNVAGWTGNPDFTTDAYVAIHEHTGGVPRRINTLCSRLLLFGYLEEAHRIDGRIVEEVARELARELGPASASP